ncbi:sulfotransferase family protein [uncultured Nocardioides sp.]|uniref:sulfotransferase family protein n=1 Tax=uncultured Nocardioides sp. TaxID=198441 RepID=UPI00262596DC|nr:sulfotransferase family protein [uncultured Nocardioides sp.]
MSSTTPETSPPGTDPGQDGSTPRVDEPAPTGKRRVLFVVGSGRSGTSTMSGTLQTLGMHVPQPEVVADESNPRGFGEPRWVVDLHNELLKRVNVQVSDARPSAWFETGKQSTNEALRAQIHEWLEQQFEEGGDELVVKDPRLAWYLGLWRSAALRAGATCSHVTMLRPVTEVVGSKQKYYAKRFGEVNRVAAWVNMMLHTERSTRGSLRAFVRYADMLDDWTVPVHDLGERFDLHAVRAATAKDIRKVHQFIDPTLRRVQLTWDDVPVPARLREIADGTWNSLDALATPGGDTEAEHARLDELRQVFTEAYEEAEAMSQSTAIAAQRAGAAGERERLGAQGAAGAPGAGPADGGRLADKVPHSVRAMVPAGARRRVRAALNRQR